MSIIRRGHARRIGIRRPTAFSTFRPQWAIRNPELMSAEDLDALTDAFRRDPAGYLEAIRRDAGMRYGVPDPAPTLRNLFDGSWQ